MGRNPGSSAFRTDARSRMKRFRAGVGIIKTSRPARRRTRIGRNVSARLLSANTAKRWRARRPHENTGARRGEQMRIVIGADHAGFPLKETLTRYIRELGHDVLDVGTHD